MLFLGLEDTSRTKTVLRRIYREQGNAKPVPIEELPIDAWTTTDHHLAAVFDAIQQLAWLYMAKNRRPKTPVPPRPDPMPRPGGVSRRRKRVNTFFSAFGLPPVETVKS